MKEKTFSEIAGESTINLIGELIKDNAQDVFYLLAAAPTGKGKSYFVKNDLYNFCKKHHYKILYLLPRRVVVDEFKAELAEDKKDDIIDVRTYHTLENNETRDYSNCFNKYKVVICDECHYFVSDSTFNPYVERSFLRIIKYAPHAIKFYITATETPIQDILTHILDKLNRKLLFLKLENAIELGYMAVTDEWSTSQTNIRGSITTPNYTTAIIIKFSSATFTAPEPDAGF